MQQTSDTNAVLADEQSPMPLGEHLEAGELPVPGGGAPPQADFCRWLLTNILARTIVDYCWLEQAGFVRDFHPTGKSASGLTKLKKRLAGQAGQICCSLSDRSILSLLLQMSFGITTYQVRARIRHLLTTNSWDQIF